MLSTPGTPRWSRGWHWGLGVPGWLLAVPRCRRGLEVAWSRPLAAFLRYQGVIREPPLPPASLCSCQGLWGWGGSVLALLGQAVSLGSPFQGNFFFGGWKGDVSPWGCPRGPRSILSSRPPRSELAMAYHSFLLEPISCHAWNKDRTRKYRPRPHWDLLTPGPKSSGNH